MITQIKRFSIGQCAKVGGLIAFVSTIIFIIPFAGFTVLIDRFLGEETGGAFHFGWLFYITAPFIYGFFASLFTVISCVIYNMVSK